MGTGYTRNDTVNNIADGNVINASDLDGEFDAVQAAFDAATGHTHDGSTAEGAPITVTGPAQEYVSTNTNFRPKTNNTYDLGSSSLQWKDLYVDGTANLDAVDIDGGAIDGTTVGATSASTGAFTTLTASSTATLNTLSSSGATITGGSINGTTVGATTASTGAFTTLSSNSTTTLNGTTIPASVTLVSTDATQTLTNKTINLTNNTLTATSAQLAAALTDETGTGSVVFSASPALTGVPTAPTAAAGTNTTQLATTAHVFAERTNTSTLTNKTLTSPVIGTIVNTGTLTLPTTTDTLVGRATTDTLTNKTISGSNNTLSNIANASLTNSSITFGSTAQALGSTVSALNGVTIGATTTSTGAFTTLSASTSLTTPLVTNAGTVALSATGANIVTAATNGVERLRIDSSGNVGVGTSSPSAPLHVIGAGSSDNAATNPTLFLTVTGAALNAIKFNGIANTDLYIGRPADADALAFGTVVSGERMRITSAGNVGIGTSSPSERLSVSGNVTITGSLSKGSGSFKIDHPIKPETHHLVHSFIEGPQADNLYRGKVALVDGTATVNLDESGRMTEGTFVALNGNVQCFTTNEDGWTAVRGKVEGNILTIEAQDAACTDTVSWLVIGERHDQHMVDTDWTDENGRVITEPEK